MELPKEFLEGEIREGFYVDSMMKRIWAAGIEVLCEIDKVCKKHNIQYFADWGTLLGTVRHKGFIPWDDDMDITMKRQDYIRFCEVAQKELPEGFVVCNIHTEPGWADMLTHVTNGRSVDFREEYLAKYHGCPYVVGIDIFPLDYLAPTKEEDEFTCSMIRIVEITAKFIDNMEDGEEKAKTVSDIENMCGVKFRNDMPLSVQMYKLGERLSMMYSEEEATHIALIPDHACNRPNDVYPKEYYASSIDMPFEYTTIPVPVGYEEILKVKYGENYRKPIIGHAGHVYPFYKKQKMMVYEELGLL